MNELWKTLTFVVVALVLTGAAFVSTRDRAVKNETFSDQGQPFFPDFKDPLACTDLEVVDFDSSTASASRFRVMFKNNRWVIPSHYDYPADARDRLSKTAAAVMDLVKDTVRSDRVEDQEEMGVVDPLDAKTMTLKGRGKRITLRDASEETARRPHHRQRDQGSNRPEICTRSRAEAHLRSEDQGRALDPVRRLDRDQPAEARGQPYQEDRVRQLQGAMIEQADNPAGRDARHRAEGLVRPLDDGGAQARSGARQRQAPHSHRRPGRPQDRRRAHQAGRACPRPEE